MNISSKNKFAFFLVALAINGCALGFSVLDSLYWSHKMGNLSLYKQQEGFLLNNLQFEAQTITNAINKRDQNAFSKLTHKELIQNIQHCFDLEMNHGNKKDKLTDELMRLVNTFNQQVRTITPETLQTMPALQIELIQQSCEALVRFCEKYGITSANSREVIQDLQKEAKSNNKPIKSVLRKEYVIPAVAIAALIGGIIVWNKWLTHKFWAWWNGKPNDVPKYKTLANDPITIGNIQCKGEEIVLSPQVKIYQARVANQTGGTCGYHALANTQIIMNNIKTGNGNALTDNQFKNQQIREWKALVQNELDRVGQTERTRMERTLENLNSAVILRPSDQTTINDYKKSVKLNENDELDVDQKNKLIEQECQKAKNRWANAHCEWINGELISTLVNNNEQGMPGPISVIDNPNYLDHINSNPDLDFQHVLRAARALERKTEYIHGFILGSMDDSNRTSGGHWISVVLYQKANGSREYIITDSLNSRNFESDNIKKLICFFEGGQIWNASARS